MSTEAEDPGTSLSLPRFCVLAAEENEFSGEVRTPGELLSRAYAKPLSYYRIDIRPSSEENPILTVFTDKWGEIDWAYSHEKQIGGSLEKEGAIPLLWDYPEVYDVLLAPFDPFESPSKWKKKKALAFRRGEPNAWQLAIRGEDRYLDPQSQLVQEASRRFQLQLQFARPYFVRPLEPQTKIKLGEDDLDIGWPVVRWDTFDTRPSDKAWYLGRYGKSLSLMGPSTAKNRTNRTNIQTVADLAEITRGVVLHFDVQRNALRTTNFWIQQQPGVNEKGEPTYPTSTHFLIDNDGTIYQLMDPLRFEARHTKYHNAARLGIDICSLAGGAGTNWNLDYCRRYYARYWDGAHDCTLSPMEPRTIFPRMAMQDMGDSDALKDLKDEKKGGVVDHYYCQYRALGCLLRGLSNALNFPPEYPRQDLLDEERTLLDYYPPKRQKTQEEAHEINLKVLKEHNDQVKKEYGLDPGVVVPGRPWARKLPGEDGTPVPLYCRLGRDSYDRGSNQYAFGSFERFRGILNHHHVNGNRYDAGPLTDWDLLMSLIRG